MRFSTRALLAFTMALGLQFAAPASAQSSYVAPGSLLERPASKKEQMEQALENARWRLGPLRLAPWFAIRDAAYVSDVFAGSAGREEPDFTITAAAGLQGYVPFGRKVFFAFDALPQYVWWQEQEDRRRVNGYYGIGLFGFFNHLNVETTARRAEEQGIITPEFAQRIHSRHDRLELTADLEVASSLFVFGAASAAELRALVEDLDPDPRLPQFQQLDREERVIRGGIEYRRDKRLRVAVGVERSEAEFLDPTRDLSNSGTSPLFELGYDTPRLKIASALAFRSLKPERGSQFEPFDETTGQLRLTLAPRWRLSYSLYGSRDLTYSLDRDHSSFTSSRIGLSISSRLGSSSSMEVFGEVGTHEYPASLTATARDDDFTGYGAAVHLKIREPLLVNAGITRSEINSPVPGLDRSLTEVYFNFELSLFGGAFTVR
jgi:hypothetical protein